MTQIEVNPSRERRPYARPALVVIGDLAQVTRTLNTTHHDDGNNNGVPHRTNGI